MAQSTDQIQNEILTDINNASELPALDIITRNEAQSLSNVTNNSKAGLLRSLIYVFAKKASVIQQLWDVLQKDIEERVSASRPFTQRWYRDTALAFQYGFNFDDFGEYAKPTTTAEIQAVEAAQIIKKAAVTQAVINGVGSLRLKLAKELSGTLEPLAANELTAFQDYIEKKGAAGVFVQATSNQADDLKLEFKIYYNPLILDNEGKRLDGQDDQPVQNAVKSFLKQKNDNNFNGRLDLVDLVDALQQVEGVLSPFVTLAASKYAAFTYTNTANNVGVFTDYRQPDSGYFKLDEANSLFNFIAT